jgi:heme o synthase
MLKTYLELIKPERTLANVITALAGFLLGANGHIRLGLLLYTLIGITLVIASACVVNNLTDRRIDRKMTRTAKRALVSGKISSARAWIFAAVIGAVGFLVLGVHVSGLVVILGVIAYLDYVIAYGYFKRRSSISTLVGTVCGSMSLVAGYCAAIGHLNWGALILFLIMVFWQMPHFYAIGLYRKKDYKAAGLPVLPVIKGDKTTKRQMLLYIVAFELACLSLAVFGYAGVFYAVVVILLGVYWLQLALSSQEQTTEAWARKMFSRSLTVLCLLCLALAIS